MASSYNQYTTANAPGFKARVEMTMLRRALAVLAITPVPTDGSVDIAKRILGLATSVPGGSDLVTRMSKIIAADNTLEAKVSRDVSGAEVSDSDLDTAVTTHFLKLG